METCRNVPRTVDEAAVLRYRRLVKIEKGKRVRIRVRLAIVDGDELEKDSVVEYFHGQGTMLAGLEKALEGLKAGDKKSGVIKAEQAFGDPSKQVKKQLTRKDFPEDAKLEKGMQFMAKGADNQQDVVLRVVAVKKDQVDIVLLHPYADKDIEFDAEVLTVSDPKPPPLPGELLTEADEE